MEVIRRLSQRFPSKTPFAGEYLWLGKSIQFVLPRTVIVRSQQKPIFNPRFQPFNPAINVHVITISRGFSSPSTARTPASWLVDLGKKKKLVDLPGIVQAGDPVLHEPAQEVLAEEIGSDRIQKIIDDMVQVMRRRPGVRLAAPQIGIPLKGILNPKLKKKSNKSTLFFEGCLSVDGYRAMVERFLEVEVTGLDRDGMPMKVDACGWQARILQHKCDHLEGTLYVDKMVKRTFRTVDNLDLPLAKGCPKQGVR